MPHFKLAHVREQGQNMLIFPLDSNVHHKTSSEKSRILNELELRAHGAGLGGSAVIIWEYGGRCHFLGPRLWQSFLQSISMLWVMQNVNRKISW